MGLTFKNVTLDGRVRVANCKRNTPLRVRFLLTGSASKGGGSFDVDIYDDDTGSDVLLTQAVGFRIRKNGKFRSSCDISLSCDKNCDVQGGLDTSGESCTEVYAHVRENGGNGSTISSNKVTLECISNSAIKITPEGLDFNDHALLSLKAPENAVNRPTKLAIDFNPDPPELEFYPDEINTDTRMITIADRYLEFAEPVLARWRLSPSELRRLTELEGSVIIYDPDAQEWSSVSDCSLEGKFVVFPITRGGLYGVASNARHMPNCRSNPFGLPPISRPIGC